MEDAELIVPGLTMGEAAVLIGQLAGEPAEHIGGWTLVFQHRETLDVGIMSSAISREEGFKRGRVAEMLLDAVQDIVNELDERA